MSIFDKTFFSTFLKIFNILLFQSFSFKIMIILISVWCIGVEVSLLKFHRNTGIRENMVNCANRDVLF